MRGFIIGLAALSLLGLGAQQASALSFTLAGSDITKINATMPGAFDLSAQFYDSSTGTFAFTMTVDSIEFNDAAPQQMAPLGNPLQLVVDVALDPGTGLYTNASQADMQLLDLGNPALLANFKNGGGQAAGLGFPFQTATLVGLYTLNGTIIQPDPTLADAMFQDELSGQIDFTFLVQYEPLADGRIVTTGGGSFAMIPNPEPTTGFLLGLGLAGLALAGRKRAR
jgi:hypothetical protein